jgi:hypothetical protein
VGYYSSITGSIDGITPESYEKIKEMLEENFMEHEYYSGDNSLNILSYNAKHYDMEDCYSLIADAISDHSLSELTDSGEDIGDISIIFFRQGEWRQIWCELVEPDNPFISIKEPNI